MKRALFLPAALALTFGLAATSIPPAEASIVTGLDALRSIVVQNTNALRAEVGAQPLAEDARLDAIAQAWAQVMADQSTLWHNPCISPQLMTITSNGGENIAMGKASDDTTVVTDQWRNSPGHYANMIDSDYTHIGIGKAYSSTGVPFWVQDFSAEIHDRDEESFSAIKVQCAKDIQDVYAETGTSEQPIGNTLPTESSPVADNDPITLDPSPSDPQSQESTPPTVKPALTPKATAVTAVKATKVKRDSTTISWKIPDKKYKVKGYSIRVQWKGHTIWQRYTSAKSSIKATHLFSHSRMKVQVRALNSRGYGAWSKATSFTTR